MFEDGMIVRSESFTTHRASEIRRHEFDEKYSKANFLGFFVKNSGFSEDHILVHYELIETSSNWTENLIWDTQDKYLRSDFKLFQKSCFLFFMREIYKGFQPKPGSSPSESCKSG